MIALSAESKILVATEPADFRKGIDGIAALCRGVLKQNARSGAFFVFINRSKTMIRILAYDGNGFWLMTKRLSKGKFQDWPRGQSVINPMTAKQLRILLSGKSGAWRPI